MRQPTSIFNPRAGRLGAGLAALVGMILWPSPAAAADGRIPIAQHHLTSPPLVITNSGSYVVVETLRVSNQEHAIEVDADDVTIDLNGHAVIGPGGVYTGTGIYQHSNRVSLTVCNGVVRDFRSTSQGGVLALGRGNRIEAVRAFSNGTGIRTGPGSLVQYCMALSNRVLGIHVLDSQVRYCTAQYNQNAGIQAEKGSSVSDCTASWNDNSGFSLQGASLVAGVARQNRGSGIYGTEAASVASSCATLNTNDGIFISPGRVVGCYAMQNGEDGIQIHTYSSVYSSAAKDNRETGIKALYYGGMIEGCVSALNGWFGIAIGNASRVSGNLLFSNGNEQYGKAFEITGAGNRLEANHICLHTNSITLSRSGNLLVRNSSAYADADHYNIHVNSTNIVGPAYSSTILWREPWANFEFGD